MGITSWKKGWKYKKGYGFGQYEYTCTCIWFFHVSSMNKSAFLRTNTHQGIRKFILVGYFWLASWQFIPYKLWMMAIIVYHLREYLWVWHFLKRYVCFAKKLYSQGPLLMQINTFPNIRFAFQCPSLYL